MIVGNVGKHFRFRITSFWISTRGTDQVKEKATTSHYLHVHPLSPEGLCNWLSSRALLHTHAHRRIPLIISQYHKLPLLLLTYHTLKTPCVYTQLISSLSIYPSLFWEPLQRLPMASFSKSSTTVLIVFLFTVFCALHNFSVSSFEFEVGGTHGWVVPPANDSKIYNDWASENRFQVGDTVRKYTTTCIHNHMHKHACAHNHLHLTSLMFMHIFSRPI